MEISLGQIFLHNMLFFDDPRSAGGGKVRGSQEHKVVEVKQLAMYWNPQSHPLGASLEAKDNQIISVLKREEDTPGKVVYLLRPTDVTLKLLVCVLLCTLIFVLYSKSGCLGTSSLQSTHLKIVRLDIVFFLYYRITNQDQRRFMLYNKRTNEG